MHIYELPISLYSFKVRLAIALKGAAIEARVPPGGSYRSPEFRAINPAGTIPTLVDGDFVLAESDAIVEYLDDKQVGTPLLPSDPQLRARTRMLSRWCDTRLEPHVRALFPMVKPSGRDINLVATADMHISSALAIFETALDRKGPFALGAQPGLVDCGLVASLAWLSTIAVTLSLSAKPGQRLARAVSAMYSNESAEETIKTYQMAVMVWLKSQLSST